MIKIKHKIKNHLGRKGFIFKIKSVFVNLVYGRCSLSPHTLCSDAARVGGSSPRACCSLKTPFGSKRAVTLSRRVFVISLNSWLVTAVNVAPTSL